MTYEGLRLKLLAYYRKKPAEKRRQQLTNTEFTIISNNCWGGMLYESYALPKQSPTVGTFFMAEDYIRFCQDLRRYTASPLTFIEPASSRHAEFLKKDARFGKYPIGVIDDIEIMFLHYHSEEAARDKWTRRCERILWDKLIVKFNDQNGCTEEAVRAFAALPFEHKLFFTIRDWPVEPWPGYCKIRQMTGDECVTASHEPFGNNRYVDLTGLINSL